MSILLHMILMVRGTLDIDPFVVINVLIGIRVLEESHGKRVLQ